MRRLLGLAAVFACGGPKAAERPVVTPPPDAAPVPVPIDAAAVAIVQPDAPPPPPPAKLDPDSLPQLKAVAAAPKAEAGPVTTIYASDAEADTLLSALEPKINYVYATTRKRVTGKLYAPKGYDAFATVAGLAGADVTAIVPKGKGAAISVDFVAAPLFDLLRLIADTGMINIVVAPGKLPDLTVRLNRVPWDQALAVMVQRAGLTTQREGNLFFIVPAGTKVPARNAKLTGPVLDVDATQATLAQITAGIRAHTKLDLGSCAAIKVTQRIKRAPVADVVRAFEVVSGEKLASPDECPAKPLESERVDKLKLVAIIAAGTKRVAVFDLDGATITGSSDDKQRFTAIGTDYVEFASGLVRQLRTGAATQGEDDDDVWVQSLRRTSALIRRDEDWRALVEQGEWTMQVDRNTHATGVEGIGFKVGYEGVHVVRDSGTELRLLPLAPK